MARPDGAEHYRACAGVPYVAEPEPVSPARPVMLAAEPVLVAEPASAEPEPIEDGAEVYAATLAALERAEAEPDDDDRAEIERAAYGSERLNDWPELRRAILKPITVQRPDSKTGALRPVTIYRGGIGPSAHYDHDRYPGDLYRKDGQAPDVIAAETVIGRATLPPWLEPDPEAMFDYLARSWADWQRAQAERRPRARKPEPVAARPVAVALAEPVATPRVLVADVARLVADVAALVASAAAPESAGTFPPARLAAIAASAATLAQLVAE